MRSAISLPRALSRGFSNSERAALPLAPLFPRRNRCAHDAIRPLVKQVADARGRFDHYTKKLALLREAQGVRRAKGKADTKDQV